MRLIAKGMSVSPGSVQGIAKIIRGVDDLKKVNDGDILVVPTSHPLYAIAVMKASALICKNGGKLSHLCVVALEMGIPCITQVSGVIDQLTDGQEISINGTEGVIYAAE